MAGSVIVHMKKTPAIPALHTVYQVHHLKVVEVTTAKDQQNQDVIEGTTDLNLAIFYSVKKKILSFILLFLNLE